MKRPALIVDPVGLAKLALWLSVALPFWIALLVAWPAVGPLQALLWGFGAEVAGLALLFGACWLDRRLFGE